MGIWRAKCGVCGFTREVPDGTPSVDMSHSCIQYNPAPVGKIPRTMAELYAENVQLKQLLVTTWRTIQSNGAAAIQYGKDMERTAAMLARELQRLGVEPDANALTQGSCNSSP